LPTRPRVESLYTKMKYLLTIFTICLVSSVSYGEDHRKHFSTGFVTGKYLLVGKGVDTNDTYHGQVEIYSEKEKLKVKRIIGGKKIVGEAVIESAAHGEATVLRIRFSENGAAYENTCLVWSDLDNHARISCYLYQPGVKTVNPGLETLFIDHHAR